MRTNESSNTPAELERIYSNRFEAHFAYRRRVWNILAAKFFSRYVPSGSVVMDLGCGHGQFINSIQCRKKFAMDLNPGVRQHLDADVIFFEQDSSGHWDLPDASLDVVFSSNFFEHLPSKQALSAMIVEARRCLRPGGRMIVMSPNIRFVGGAYWDFWDHHVALTDYSMSELLEMHSFHIERAIDRFLPYTMVNTRPVPTVLISVYLALPPLWKIFGKQFLIIASKSDRP